MQYIQNPEIELVSMKQFKVLRFLYNNIGKVQALYI